MDLIASEFSLITKIEIEWPEESSDRAFNRIYRRNLRNPWSRKNSVGSGCSLLVLVEDKAPLYGFVESASGEIIWGNKRVIETKKIARTLPKDGYRFGIHSSTNWQEFVRDSSIALGPDLLCSILEDWVDNPASVTTEISLVSAPIGNTSWDSWEEFFAFTALAESYVVLSQQNSLDHTAESGDVDFLCSSVWSFAASAGAELEVEGSRKPRFIVEIGGKERLLDLSEPGDGRFPMQWQSLILDRSQRQRSHPFVENVTWIPMRLFRLVCQKTWSNAYQELKEIFESCGFKGRPSERRVAEIVGGYLAHEGVSLEGLSLHSVSNPRAIELIIESKNRILAQAETSWKEF